MTRPGIVRADTIDLQDHDTPSAQNHTARPNPSQTKQSANSPNSGTIAPHQAETLREVAAETAEEEAKSPRVSWANGGEAGDLQQYAEDLAAGVLGSANMSGGGADGDMAARARQDDLAVAQNGGLVSQDGTEDGDVDGDEGDLDDDMMDKISSSPSIDDEDIDFELVYALHTFIATVEGQANATKGDAMVLLDDSNSYWWLVRVVKDSSIGYLPAEHIETPTERLARLNKHRNIDLSATMLGDQAEKAKNPIKTAMRRRKAKNVTFAAPTFVDYSDYDYDTEDEEEENLLMAQQQQQLQQQQQQSQQSQQQASAAKQTNGEDGDKDEDSAKVAPLRPRAQQKSGQVADHAKADLSEESSNGASKAASRTSEEIFETNGVEGPKKRADGTVRDSFFKDDTVETKKITLTPGLLRDDGVTRASSDSIEKGIKQRPSFDKLLEKDSKEDKKRAKDKKEKEKKSGFRSLFSRKDKKRGEEDDDSFGKRSMETGTEPLDRPSEDIGDELGSDKGMSPQRNPSKLQKQQPRVESSLARKAGGAQRDAGDGMDLSTFLNESSLKNVSNVPPASMRIVDPDADLFEDDDDDDDDESKPQQSATARSASVDDYKQNAPKQAPTRSLSVDDQKTAQTTAVKSRMQIEDSDSDEGAQETTQAPVTTDKSLDQPEPQPSQPEKQKSQRPVLPGSFPDSYTSVVSTESTSTVTAEKSGVASQPRERLSESPVEVSPITPTEAQPPPLTGDNSSQEHSSPVSSPSPELIDREEAGGVHRNQDSITTSTSTTTVSAWNDTSLRAFFDSGADIRDLLVVVYDKNDVEPVGPDHPVAGALFKEQNAKLAEITTQLDNMLGDWLARKQRLRGTV